MAANGGVPDLSSKPVREDDDEGEYESDPEEVVPLGLRRREASDDEEEEEVPQRRRDRRLLIGGEVESDGEGRPAAYEEEEDVEGEEEEEFEEVDEELEEEELEEAVVRRAGGTAGRAGQLASPGDGGPDEGGSGVQECEAVPDASDFRGKNQAAASQEEKKENEPFAVPTAGAFYMHDDRFRDNGGARHRRTPGGRKLWESKDDRAWVHDRFEEMNLKETQYNEGKRGSKGRFRGRGRGRGRERGFARGSRSRYFDENMDKTSNQPPRTVKGRGPRKYEPLSKNQAETPPSHTKPASRSNEMSNKVSEGGSAPLTGNPQYEAVAARKQVFASILSSDSPPFYPSGTSTQDVSAAHKKDVQVGSAVRNMTTSAAMDENIMGSNSNIAARGKAILEPVGQGGPYVGHSARHTTVGKPSPTVHIHSSGSSSSVTMVQSPQLKVRVAGSGQLNYQFPPSSSPMSRVSAHTTLATSQMSVSGQPNLRPSAQQVNQRPGVGPQESPSAPQVPSLTRLPEVSEVGSPPGSSKSKTGLVGKMKVSNQGSGKSAFLYNGAQVVGATGATGVGNGDQSFPHTPALLPVMQFGGQHHGGLGVPAVGMAFPGYVAQPQGGFGNSEMTWLPVLAGAAGALGASYCSPYIAFDGGYFARSSGQASSTGSSGDSNSNKSSSTWKSPQKPAELVNDEYGQRQNKPRRYSEMNFGQ
ncbi:protein MLN51 homolog [Nymphaea colorata]|nr:protein MLN51 homolog [Nymphaea colorata]XP_031493966.1 protein MLN51 homolog [Nymphaea colorata]